MTRKSGPRRRCLMQRFCQSGEPDQEDTRLAASGNLWSAPDRAVIGLVEAGVFRIEAEEMLSDQQTITSTAQIRHPSRLWVLTGSFHFLRATFQWDFRSTGFGPARSSPHGCTMTSPGGGQPREGGFGSAPLPAAWSCGTTIAPWLCGPQSAPRIGWR